MIVLHLITRINRGGTASWLRNLDGLEANFRFSSLFAAGNLSEQETEDEYFVKAGYIKINNLQKRISLPRDFLAFLEIRQTLMRIKPDILNTHTSKAGLLGRLANASIIGNRTKVIHTFHGHLLYGYFPRPITFLLTKIEAFLEFFTDAYVVSGEKVKRELIAAGIGEKTPWVQINPGIPNMGTRDKSISRMKLNIDVKDFVVGWMGRLESIKRPKLFLDLARLVPEAKFVIAGEGSLREDLEKDSPKNVSFVDWVNTEVFWSACDLAVSTSENEAQPYALIEAGLSGLPLIAFDVGGIEGVIKNGLNGYLCETIDEIAEKILFLRLNKNKLVEFGTSSVYHMKRNFSISEFKDKHIELYDSLVLN